MKEGNSCRNNRQRVKSRPTCICSCNVNSIQRYFCICIQQVLFDSLGERIYMLYDVPHIFKNIRNNLLTHKFVIDGKVIAFFCH